VTVYNLKDKYYYVIHNYSHCTGYRINTTAPPVPNNQLSNASAFLNFGPEYNEVYVGPDVVRGIAANHWTASAYEAGFDTPASFVNFTTDWWFSSPAWNMSTSGSSVPLKAWVRGVANTRSDVTGLLELHNFSHDYEFVMFAPTGDYANQNWLWEIPAHLACYDNATGHRVVANGKSYYLSGTHLPQVGVAFIGVAVGCCVAFMLSGVVATLVAAALVWRKRRVEYH